MFYYSNHANKKHKGKSFVLLLWLLFLPAFVFSQQQYELNDPRNPDCPCHKAQKQAEQEFAQLNLSKKNVIADPAIKPLATNTTSNSAVAVAGKSKRKNKALWIKKLKFRYFRTHRGIKKMHTDYAVCFHKW